MLNRAIEILLIEDNPADADLTREALERGKLLLNMHHVTTGEVGLQYLRKMGEFSGSLRPDMILLDLNLPGLDGREVLREIRSDSNLRSIPVVILTSSEADLDILKSYTFGANCYIVKPVGFDKFMQIVDQIESFWFSIVKLPVLELVEKYRKTSRKSVTEGVAEIVGESDMWVQVLLVEDHDPDADVVIENLTQGARSVFKVSRVNTLAEGLEHLKRNGVDLVLLDLSLPDSHGFNTVERVVHAHPGVPIIVLTGFEDDEFALSAAKVGAQDYLVKGVVSPRSMKRAVIYAIERKMAEVEKVEAIKREHTARREAERAVGIRDEFLSVASHELRTPLTALKLQIGLVRRLSEMGKLEFPNTAKFTRALGGAERDIERFCKLVETLLDVSRIQSGRLQLEYSNFDMASVLGESVARLEPEFATAQCKVGLHLSGPVFGNWDRLRIDQILTNLLTNAAKYARGHPVDVYLKSTDECVELRVQDHGVGVSQDDRERIFQRFERAIGDKDKGISGFGLGLYIVRQIVNRHGGSVHVESEVGKGATFIVRLPIKPSLIPGLAQSAEKRSQRQATGK